MNAMASASAPLPISSRAAVRTARGSTGVRTVPSLSVRSSTSKRRSRATTGSKSHYRPRVWRPRRRARGPAARPRRMARDAVERSCGLATAIAEPHIARDLVEIAPECGPKTAAARRLQAHASALADSDVGRLRGERRRRLAGIALPDEPVERAGPAAIDAEGRKFSPLPEQEDVGAVAGEHLDLVDGAEPAAVAARAR